jgi:hypothetical protein
MAVCFSLLARAHYKAYKSSQDDRLAHPGICETMFGIAIGLVEGLLSLLLLQL